MEGEEGLDDMDGLDPMMGDPGGGDLDEKSALRHVRKPSQVLSQSLMASSLYFIHLFCISGA